jgi:uncharacterized membrane protein
VHQFFSRKAAKSAEKTARIMGNFPNAESGLNLLMAFPLFRSLLIGTVAGMRCMSAPAIVVSAIASDKDESISPLGDPRMVKFFDIAAGVELAADKLPQIGSRTETGPLVVRAVSGAVSGAVVSRRNQENILLGALAGGLAAVISAHLFYTARKHANLELGIPDPLLAVAEDTAAWTLGQIAVSRDSAL